MKKLIRHIMCKIGLHKLTIHIWNGWGNHTVYKCEHCEKFFTK